MNCLIKLVINQEKHFICINKKKQKNNKKLGQIISTGINYVTVLCPYFPNVFNVVLIFTFVFWCILC